MGIEPTYQLVTGTTGLKPGGPTRCPTAPTKLWGVRRQPVSKSLIMGFTASVYSIRRPALSRGIAADSLCTSDASVQISGMRVVGIDTGRTFTDSILFDGRAIRDALRGSRKGAPRRMSRPARRAGTISMYIL